VLQDVDAAEAGGGVLEGLGQRVVVEHVRRERGGGDALGGEPVGQVVELGAVAGDESDVVAARAEGAGDGEAHSGAGSDDGDAGHGEVLSSKWTRRPTFDVAHRTAETGRPFHLGRVGV
jgi:hypothetical protein